MRVALAQINQTVGDVEGNARRIVDAIRTARTKGAQILVTPELSVTGYPPEDLVLKDTFIAANLRALERIATEATDVLTVVGFVEPFTGGLYDSAAVCHEGRVIAVYRKHLLPNYGVFDERRYFEAGEEHILFESSQGTFGVSVCEDVWEEDGPVVVQGLAGAQMVLNINASPFHKGKLAERAEMLGDRARRGATSIVYVNMVGGQDELVFDGGSLVIDERGDVVARLPQFEELVAVVEVPLGPPGGTEATDVRTMPVALGAAGGRRPEAPLTEPLPAEIEIYRALRLALHDYVVKNRFDRVVLGLSGGIDSSLTAAIAVDALGPESVLGVAMPSEFSTPHSISDAKELATNLGIEMMEIPIEPVYASLLRQLDQALGTHKSGIAEENLQARIRGNLLMFISNRDGHLVLATGNKSEGACGYATLYGDMAGGFALIKDVFKQEVYALSRYRNTLSDAIPNNVLTKPPSAELRHEQKDEDSLPPYEILDPILIAYIEHDAGVDEIVRRGFDREMVQRVIALVDRAEYKRRQAPPGPKVTVKAFGRDRRLPISNGWRESEQAPIPEKVVGESGPN
jgi:NAD+ synthase (glutamine-hydrolysing)